MRLFTVNEGTMQPDLATRESLGLTTKYDLGHYYTPTELDTFFATLYTANHYAGLTVPLSTADKAQIVTDMVGAMQADATARLTTDFTVTPTDASGNISGGGSGPPMATYIGALTMGFFELFIEPDNTSNFPPWSPNAGTYPPFTGVVVSVIEQIHATALALRAVLGPLCGAGPTVPIGVCPTGGVESAWLAAVAPYVDVTWDQNYAFEGPNPLSAIGNGIRRYHAATGKPVVAVIQTQGYQIFTGAAGNGKLFRCPNRAETNLSVWDAIINGAAGLLFYPYYKSSEPYNVEQSPTILADRKAIGKQIKTLEAIATAPHVAPATASAIVPNFRSAWLTGNGYFTFLGKASYDAGTGTVTFTRDLTWGDPTGSTATASGYSLLRQAIANAVPSQITATQQTVLLAQLDALFAAVRPVSFVDGAATATDGTRLPFPDDLRGTLRHEPISGKYYVIAANVREWHDSYHYYGPYVWYKQTDTQQASQVETRFMYAMYPTGSHTFPAQADATAAVATYLGNTSQNFSQMLPVNTYFTQVVNDSTADETISAVQYYLDGVAAATVRLAVYEDTNRDGFALTRLALSGTLTPTNGWNTWTIGAAVPIAKAATGKRLFIAIEILSGSAKLPRPQRGAGKGMALRNPTGTHLPTAYPPFWGGRAQGATMRFPNPDPAYTGGYTARAMFLTGHPDTDTFGASAPLDVVGGQLSYGPLTFPAYGVLLLEITQGP